MNPVIQENPQEDDFFDLIYGQERRHARVLEEPTDEVKLRVYQSNGGFEDLALPIANVYPSSAQGLDEGSYYAELKLFVTQETFRADRTPPVNLLRRRQRLVGGDLSLLNISGDTIRDGSELRHTRIKYRGSSVGISPTLLQELLDAVPELVPAREFASELHAVGYKGDTNNGGFSENDYALFLPDCIHEDSRLTLVSISVDYGRYHDPESYLLAGINQLHRRILNAVRDPYALDSSIARAQRKDTAGYLCDIHEQQMPFVELFYRDPAHHLSLTRQESKKIVSSLPELKPIDEIRPLLLEAGYKSTDLELSKHPAGTTMYALDLHHLPGFNVAREYPRYLLVYVMNGSVQSFSESYTRDDYWTALALTERLLQTPLPFRHVAIANRGIKGDNYVSVALSVEYEDNSNAVYEDEAIKILAKEPGFESVELPSTNYIFSYTPQMNERGCRLSVKGDPNFSHLDAQYVDFYFHNEWYVDY